MRITCISLSTNATGSQLLEHAGIGGGRVIVCVCNALGEAQVRAAARAGSKRPACAYARLGCKPVCGQCLPFARQVIRDETARAN